MIVNSFAIVLLLPAIYIAATHYGALGAAYVWVALNLAYLLVATPLMHRKLLSSEMWRWYRLDILFPLLVWLGWNRTRRSGGSGARRGEDRTGVGDCGRLRIVPCGFRTCHANGQGTDIKNGQANSIMLPKPMITIIIPTRNRCDTLAGTLKTCVEQNHDSLSIVVSDNCSDDNTRDVVHSFHDERIRYLRTPNRLSMTGQLRVFPG